MIRFGNIYDTHSIAELTKQLGYTLSYSEQEKRIRQVLMLTDHVFYVFEENEQVVGWIHGFHTHRIESESFVEIAGLVVHSEFRGRGIGVQLVKQMEAWSKNLGCLKIRVRSNVIRKEAHRFYQQLGYSTTKEQAIFDKKLV